MDFAQTICFRHFEFGSICNSSKIFRTKYLETLLSDVIKFPGGCYYSVNYFHNFHDFHITNFHNR